MSEIAKPNYEQLITRIGSVLTEGRNRVATAINTALVQSYWTIGQHIVEYEQQGNERAEYGSNLLDRLVKDLRERYGVGFSRSNIHYMRKLYIAFPKVQTLSELLTNQLFVSKYQLYLPDETSLRQQVQRIIEQRVVGDMGQINASRERPQVGGSRDVL